MPRRGPIDEWRTWWREAARTLPPELDDARRQGFVLSSAQLAIAGVTRSGVRHRVSTQRWTCVCRGAVGVVDVRDGSSSEWQRRRRLHALQAAGAALTNRNHLARTRSAAILLGLPTLDVPVAPELVVHPRAATGRRRTSEAMLTSADLVRWWGVPVTAPARTVADLLRTNRCDGLMAADAALYERLVTKDQLSWALSAMDGWPGIRQARELLPLATALSESPLESLVRLRLHDDGIAAPHQQVKIAVPGRAFPYRVDFLWPEHRLVLEADGRDKYDHAELRRERIRDRELRASGYRIERVFWSDVVHRWPETLAVLRHVLGA